jgi:hypothetical protein
MDKGPTLAGHVACLTGKDGRPLRIATGTMPMYVCFVPPVVIGANK